MFPAGCLPVLGIHRQRREPDVGPVDVVDDVGNAEQGNQPPRRTMDRALRDGVAGGHGLERFGVSMAAIMVRILRCTLLATTVVAAEAATAPLMLPPYQPQPEGASIFADEAGFTADVTADGRLAVVFTQPFGRGTNQNPARIENRNLQTNERVILSGGVSNVGTPGRPAAAFSPDGQLVAYTWLDPQLTDTGMLQVIDVESGSQPRTVIPADPSDRGIIPHGWSPDGARILVLIHGPSVSMDRDPTSLAWVNVADGRMQTIKTLEPWRDGGASLPRLSRDGRWIAYSTIEREGSNERGLHVIDAQSGAERQLGRVPGSSSSPVWSPDGSRLMFVNEQGAGATADLLAVNVDAPAAPPVRLQSALGGVPLTITNAGTLYWMRFDWGWKGFVLQPSRSGRQVVDQFSGHGVTWLGDDQLTFGRDGGAIIVRAPGPRTERAYPRPVSGLAPRVLRGGGAALLHIPAFGDDGRPGGGFYRLDFATGAFDRLFSKDDAGLARSNVSALSPDNQALYLGILTGSPARWSGITAVSVNSGRESRFIGLPEFVPPVQGIAVSPDGRTLALHTSDGRIFTCGVDGGTARQIAGPSPGGGWSDVVRWSRDGRYIVYGTRSDPPSTTWRLMRVKSSGGVAEPSGVDSSQVPIPGRLFNFEFSPDGERVALTIRAEPRFDVGAIRGVASRF